MTTLTRDDVLARIKALAPGGRLNLRWADLRRARTEYPILSIPTPSGPTVLIHTGGAWRLDIGCWQKHTVRELRDLIATDDGWPQATGEECARRRPILAAVADLCDAHIAYHCATLKGQP